MSYRIAAFYKFLALTDLPSVKAVLMQKFAGLDLCGTVLLASEGINGTIAGSAFNLDTALKQIQELFDVGLSDIKFSNSDELPFKRFKIRLKKEIITFRQPGADPNRQVGTLVEAKDWNQIVSDPEVVVLDTRNKYETMVGTFKGALDPNIEQFTDFASYVRSHLDPSKHKKIAMYCTGGIRCEKASSFMLAEGFEEVYHLKGGILKYLEEVDPQQSMWNGDCYVFDRRIAVGHGLTTGHYSMCFYCGYALREEDRSHPHFEDGVSCEHCYSITTKETKANCRARHQQLTSGALTKTKQKNNSEILA